MVLKDLISYEEIFYPRVFYSGEWLLGGFGEHEYLKANALIRNEHNAYEQYLEKNYYQPLTNIIGSSVLAKNFNPQIAFVVDEVNKQRTTAFSIASFMSKLISSIFFRDDETQKIIDNLATLTSIDEWIQSVKQMLKIERRFFIDVQKKGTNSLYYNEVYRYYLEYMKTTNNYMDLDFFLENKIASATKLIIGTRYYKNFFSKDINVKELVEAFDYDKLCLIVAYSAIETCHLTEQECNSINNAISYVKMYLDRVFFLRKINGKYNPSIVVINSESKRKKIIKIEDIKKEYDALIVRHPEFNFFMVNDEEIETLLRTHGVHLEELKEFDISKQDNQELLLGILQKFYENKELAVEWDFIPRGKREEKKKNGNFTLYHSSAIPEEESIRRMVIVREYLENSPYIYKVYGKYKFEGYIGYIYNNGSVIFKKYYENVKTKKVANAAAIYVMSLYNFLEMSKLSKSEIINMIKKNTTDVKRIFHREDMSKCLSELEQAIMGDDYSSEVMEYINALLSKNELKKNEVKI